MVLSPLGSLPGLCSFDWPFGPIWKKLSMERQEVLIINLFSLRYTSWQLQKERYKLG